MFHIRLTIKNVHGICPQLVMRSYIKDVLHLPVRPIKGYHIDTNAQRIVYSAYFDSHPLIEPHNTFFEAYFTTDGTDWGKECTGRESEVAVNGFTNMTSVETTNCGDTFEFYQHEYPDIAMIPDTIIYQVLDTADIPVFLPGYEIWNKTTTLHLFNDDTPMPVYIATFKRRGTWNAIVQQIFDTVSDVILPHTVAEKEQHGKYRTWLHCE